jgi:hypothetical protein
MITNFTKQIRQKTAKVIFFLQKREIANVIFLAIVTDFLKLYNIYKIKKIMKHFNYSIIFVLEGDACLKHRT